jgi:TolB-like protein
MLRAERRLAAIMFTDIVGYTALMGRDEQAGRRVREHHRAVVGAVVPEYGGTLVDENGDELVATFTSALDATNCALAVQVQVRRDPDLEIRTGIHIGDVVFEGGQIYGDGVNLAARVRERAEPRGICVTGEVWQTVRNQSNFESTALGEIELKNVDRPVSLFVVSGTPAKPSPAVQRSDLSDPSQIRSLAVLPLQSLSSDAEHENLADGMTETLIGALSKISALRVTSRTSAMRHKKSHKTVREIAGELDVDALIEGSVVREGDRIRVAVQLIDGRSDHLVWAERYERDFRGILPLQSEVARTVANQIRLQLTPREKELLAGPLERWFARRRRISVPED